MRFYHLIIYFNLVIEIVCMMYNLAEFIIFYIIDMIRYILRQ